MFFRFSFGVKKKTIIQTAVMSIVMTSVVAGLHRCTGISENNIWNLIDKSQRELKKKNIPGISIINSHIINTPDLLNQRVESDINDALQEYERWERGQYRPRMKNQDILKEIKKSKYTETQRRVVEDAVYYECNSDESHAQKLLGGAQGIHSSWYNSKECNE